MTNDLDAIKRRAVRLYGFDTGCVRSPAEDFTALCGEVKRLGRLTEFLSAKVGGETPGDTLIRLAEGMEAEFPQCPVGDVTPNEWTSWLRDFGTRLNTAAGAAEEER